MKFKIKKNIPLIDQHDKNFMYGGKFGGNFIPETLKKPIDDLTKLFDRLRKDKKFLKERDHYFETYVGAPTPFIKLENLTKDKERISKEIFNFCDLEWNEKSLNFSQNINLQIKTTSNVQLRGKVKNYDYDKYSKYKFILNEYKKKYKWL